jgi:hypothetical protein
MADTRITALAELAERPAAGDVAVIVDISDTSMATSGTDKKIAFSNLGSDFLSPLLQAEISITGAATATLNRMHVCSGTSVDYTVTLPPASGNAGAFVGLRMASGLTKLVTVDGNAAETINGATTRVFWANESVTLICDGANWFAKDLHLIPMAARMVRAAAQSVFSDTVTTIDFDTTLFDVGSIADLANNRINIRRGGNYQIFCRIKFPAFSATDYISVYPFKNGATRIIQPELVAGVSGGMFIHGTEIDAFVAGDSVTLVTYFLSASGPKNTDTNNHYRASLAMVEVPNW